MLRSWHRSDRATCRRVPHRYDQVQLKCRADNRFSMIVPTAHSSTPTPLPPPAANSVSTVVVSLLPLAYTSGRSPTSTTRETPPPGTCQFLADPAVSLKTNLALQARPVLFASGVTFRDAAGSFSAWWRSRAPASDRRGRADPLAGKPQSPARSPPFPPHRTAAAWCFPGLPARGPARCPACPGGLPVRSACRLGSVARKGRCRRHRHLEQRGNGLDG
jgi:hypothetical protein